MRRRGFTLAEMLIVLAIIAVLASLLLVASRQAWFKALTTKANMEQRGTELNHAIDAANTDE